jgi:hypothetical protein
MQPCVAPRPTPMNAFWFDLSNSRSALWQAGSWHRLLSGTTGGPAACQGANHFNYFGFDNIGTRVPGLMDFQRQLAKQIGFLERSCKAYDHGYIDESIRIATVIRVLIHDTPRSTSLLRHLNATHIDLVSTIEPKKIPAGGAASFAMGSYTMGSAGSTWHPVAQDSPRYQLPVHEWWIQLVFGDMKHYLSRKNIVLAAANKDGGAHVDSDLTPAYAALAQSGSVGIFGFGRRNDPAHVEVPIEDGHLGYLRAFGYELLSSRELHNLI